MSFSINDVSCLEKIIPMLESKSRTEAEQLLEKIKTIVIYSDSSSIKEQDSQELKNKYNIISKAIKNNIDVEIEYKNKNKIVTPHNMSFYKDFIYLTGYSKTDKDLRTYNLSEIKIK